MSATSSRVAGATGVSGPDARAAERRSFWIAGIVLFGAIAVLTTITVLSTSYGPRKDTLNQLEEQGGAKPHIIPRPGEGERPKNPGDRGGWEQFLVLGLVVGAIGAIGGLVWRSSRRARARVAATEPARPSGSADRSAHSANATDPSP